jgi:hypothetical protein
LREEDFNDFKPLFKKYKFASFVKWNSYFSFI